MSIAKGFNRYLCVKAQPSFGTKATGLATTLIPLRGGSIFEPNVIKALREDAYSVLPPRAHYYDAPKIVPWSANFYLINPTTGAPTIRDFMRAAFGLETLAAGPPITKTYSIYDEVIDGATDDATHLYGRALTLHEECTDSAGNKIYADEVQDAVVDEIAFTFNPDRPTTVSIRGMSSDIQDGAAHITPAYPTQQAFNFDHLKDTANAGLRIGTANPPTVTDNAVFSQGVLTLSNNIRYVPFNGNGVTKQVRYPTRDGVMGINLDVTMDVENAIANQWDADDATAQYKVGTGVNFDLLSYIDANNIFQVRASAATAAAFVESYTRNAPGMGAMQYTARIKVAPANLADVFAKMTTPS